MLLKIYLSGSIKKIGMSLSQQNTTKNKGMKTEIYTFRIIFIQLWVATLVTRIFNFDLDNRIYATRTLTCGGVIFSLI